MPITSRFAAAAARAYGMFSNLARAVDPFFNYVTALLHGDGTNGAQNNTFLDSSTNNFTITRNGNTTQGTFSPFSQTGWSNYYSGSSQYLSLAGTSAFSIATSTTPFTVECWVFATASTTGTIFAERYTGGANTISLQCGFDSGTTWASGLYPTFGYFNGSAWSICRGTAQITLNTWTHIAYVFTGSTCKIYVNGIDQTNSTPTPPTTWGVTGVSGDAWYTGGNGDLSVFFSGYISNLRFVNGTAVYTGNFTPSTTPLTAITNTALLTSQSNRFIDNSSNALALTANGSPSVQAFSPFNPTSAWSASSNGGSGYFDGSGDYLSVADNAAFDLSGSTSWCIETWVYWASTVNEQHLLEKFTNPSGPGWTLYKFYNNPTYGSTIDIYGGSSSFNSGFTPVAGQWYHVVVCRNNTQGRTSFFINGTRTSTSTTFSIANNASTPLLVGARQGPTAQLNGYLSSARVVKGDSVYDPSQTSITVPTAPLTAITNTSLLLNYTNAGIYDNAAVSDYETIGNAQVSTSVKKYGTGSMYFDGAGDYLFSPTSQQFGFGTSDFTVEGWVYLNTLPASATASYLTDFRNGSVNNFTFGVIGSGSSAFLYQFVNSGTVNQTGTIAVATGTWYHFAFVRIGSTLTMYLNGTACGSASTSYSQSATSLVVGARYTGATEYVNGYIDDLRITKGVGRYQYNFTPPAAAFPNIGGTVTLTADPYFRYTTLLLPGNGTNGAQNNTFLDSSSNAFTITRNGNTTQGNFSPFSQTGWGVYFDGSGDYLDLTPGAIGTGDFTLECWVYFTSLSSDQGIVDTRSNSNTNGFALLGRSTGQVSMADGTSLIGTAASVSANQWIHVAASRSSGVISFYVNGTRSGSTLANTTNFSNNRLRSGAIGSAGENLNGYVSNARLTNTAIYSGTTITVPTAPLTAVTGTTALICQSNRFIDNSSSNNTITITGNTSVQAFSPFAPTAAWSASTNGGSGYFDGSGDYLQAGTNANLALGSGNFTIEGWLYCTGYNGGACLYSTINTYPSSTGLLFYIDSIGRYTIDVNGTILQPAGAATLNTWTHWAVVRNSTTLSIYINGTSIGSVSSSTNFTDQYAVVGRTGAGTNSNLWLGYLADTRMVKGTAVYTANFTPPSAPLTAITNTQLLLSYTNGGIVDATAKNDLETVGNAQISTTQSKFGGSSMYFDGNGDYLYVAPAQNLPFLFGSGDFTVEGWIYPSTVSGYQYICSVWGIVGQADSTYSSWQLRTNSANLETVLQSGATTTVITGSGTSLTANAWQHVALTRYGSTVKLFINGIQVASQSYSSTLNSPASAFVVGLQLSNNNTFTGYIDDLRITKGIARYTSNFTPPTSAFLLQ